MPGRSISAGTGSLYPFKSITGKSGIRPKGIGSLSLQRSQQADAKIKDQWQDVDTVLALFGKQRYAARKQYRVFVEKGILEGKKSELTGGGLIRSAGGWGVLKSLRRMNVYFKSDERILGDSDFVERVLCGATEKMERKYRLEAMGYDFDTIAAKHPDGILSISLHSPVLSFPYYINHVAPTLKQGLSCLNGKAGQVIDDYELRGVGTKSDYDKACMEFTKRHVTRTWPLPEAMKKLIAARNAAIHDIMVASGSELNVPGNLKTVNVTSQLSKLDVPVLMTCGSNDLCTPAYTKWQSGFANDPQCHIIQGSAHMTPVDRPLELLRLQRAFLREVENPSNHRVHRTR